MSASSSPPSPPLSRLRPCGRWRCLFAFDGAAGPSAECPVCFEDVAPGALLPCGRCAQAYCVLCRLRDVEVAGDRRPACAFCRESYTAAQVEELQSDYEHHRDQLPALTDMTPTRAGAPMVRPFARPPVPVTPISRFTSEELLRWDEPSPLWPDSDDSDASDDLPSLAT